MMERIRFPWCDVVLELDPVPLEDLERLKWIEEGLRPDSNFQKFIRWVIQCLEEGGQPFLWPEVWRVMPPDLSDYRRR